MNIQSIFIKNCNYYVYYTFPLSKLTEFYKYIYLNYFY